MPQFALGAVHILEKSAVQKPHPPKAYYSANLHKHLFRKQPLFTEKFGNGNPVRVDHFIKNGFGTHLTAHGVEKAFQQGKVPGDGLLSYEDAGLWGAFANSEHYRKLGEAEETLMQKHMKRIAALVNTRTLVELGPGFSTGEGENQKLHKTDIQIGSIEGTCSCWKFG